MWKAISSKVEIPTVEDFLYLPADNPSTQFLLLIIATCPMHIW
jgi:hypothetical protein